MNGRSVTGRLAALCSSTLLSLGLAGCVGSVDPTGGGDTLVFSRATK